MKEIIFDNVEKRYGDNVVIPHLNLKVEPGERVILLGPSGCGKSTTLRMIAGLEEISGGKLIMNDRVVNDVAPGDRDVSMVFQNYALYPHMTVKENITYGLKANKVDKSEIERRLKNVLDMLALEEYSDRKPNQLSGGQRQRVALARAVAKNSSYLLLDEPLSNLDAQLRLQARRELVRLHDNFNMTFVYVTHDQVEAMTVAQKIVLMNAGQIQMVGSPDEIYYNPSNVFTAKFIGSPPMNVFLVSFDGGDLIFDQERRIKVKEELLPSIDTTPNKKYYLGIRPENIKLVESDTENSLRVKVKYLENLGSITAYYFDLADATACLTSENHSIREGDEINIAFPEKSINLFDYDSQENITRR
ncbi:ABC transporter ATP-binding protein [Anaerococcus sp. Marseille-Q5996]|uniref:ABC transporter ATP-binding protein n=1 Tax=Anaerococcus sp. Marseille-Q5996 TaxID=2972769 RepID=UPI0021CA8C35|nr:ABC transporter ATP-binding protein [Anaerococcus sp. Marseille-Q5996]